MSLTLIEQWSAITIAGDIADDAPKICAHFGASFLGWKKLSMSPTMSPLRLSRGVFFVTDGTLKVEMPSLTGGTRPVRLSIFPGVLNLNPGEVYADPTQVKGDLWLAEVTELDLDQVDMKADCLTQNFVLPKKASDEAGFSATWHPDGALDTLTYFDGQVELKQPRLQCYGPGKFSYTNERGISSCDGGRVEFWDSFGHDREPQQIPWRLCFLRFLCQMRDDPHCRPRRGR